MGIITKFRVLSWKYLKFRQYYMITTLIEFILPIILVFVVAKIGNQFALAQSTKHNVTIEQIMLRGRALSFYMKYKLIYYTSYHTPADAALLMKKLGHIFASYGPIKVNLVQVGSELDLIGNVTQKNTYPDHQVAGVVFVSILPVLEYKIRDNNLWNTNELYHEQEKESNGPYAPDPYFTTGFSCLQEALDLAFYEFYKEKVLPFETMELKSHIQPFPYPEYVSTASVRSFIPSVLGFVIIICSLILTEPLAIAVITEKETGLKEWMKMVGVGETVLWFTWFINSLLFSIVIYTIVTFQLRFELYGQNSALLRFVQPSLLWTCIVLYYIAQISFCFLFCAIFNHIAIATASLGTTTVVVAFISMIAHDWRNVVIIWACCLCPSGALMQIFNRFTYFELLEIPLTWSSIFISEVSGVDISIGKSLLVLIFDTFVYLFSTYYISNISPGKYGFRQPWYFLFKKNSLQYVISSSSTKQKRTTASNVEKFIEAEPAGSDPSLQIENLQKTYGYYRLLINVNLSAYRNQILVLLGHNGAGKTTMLSIITGLTAPTSGKITFRGNTDVIKNLEEFRKNLGTCPQDDRLFPYLNVMDHLLLFGMLKGNTYDKVVKEAREYLKLMELNLNEDEFPATLPTSVKRKLSLSIALMGKAEVLILDEPTAGIDDFSKQRIWKLLQKLKPNRTIILTSHLVKEAENADRIAILNNGLIACNGSVGFLKQVYGSGYQMKITRTSVAEGSYELTKPYQTLVKIVSRIVPESKLDKKSPSELIFHLPTNATPKFAEMFRALESQKTDLKIERLGLTFTTLEQIFFKVSRQGTFDFPLDSVNVPGFSEALKLMSVTSVKNIERIIQQQIALFRKKWLFLYRHGIVFGFRVFIPSLLMLLLIRGTLRYEKSAPPLELNLKLYPGTSVILAKTKSEHKYKEEVSKFSSALSYSIGRFNVKQLYLSTSYDTVSTLLEYGSRNINSYRRDILFAVDPNTVVDYSGTDDPRITLSFYNKWFRHSLPVLVNTINNGRLYYYSASSLYKIKIINHPIKTTNTTGFEKETENEFTEKSPMLSVWFFLLVFFSIDLLDYLIMSTKVERIAGFKHVQLLSGVSTLAYWINTFLFDFILFNIVLMIRIFILKSFDDYKFFTWQLHMFIVILLLTLFITSGLFFMYVMSFFRVSKYGSYMTFFIFNLSCAAIAYLFYRVQSNFLNEAARIDMSLISLTIINYLILLIPPLNYSLAFIKFMYAWRINYEASLNMTQTSVSEPINVAGTHSYLAATSKDNPNGIYQEVVFLVVDVFLYILLLMVLENNFLYKVVNSWMRKQDKINPEELADIKNIHSSIKKERENVKELTDAIRTENLHLSNVLIVDDLHKIYPHGFRNVTAVKNVSFVVQTGECFALIGREGSGKSATFKMLAGEIIPTKGTAWINNFSMDKNKTKYLSQIGYCPEKNYILEYLTGKELLDIVASLRGIRRSNRKAAVNALLIIQDLETVQHKLTGTYSGGNKRKLCSAMALISRPNVLLLDNPTYGVDPISKNKLYTVLKQAKMTGQVVSFTTLSMEDCENICDRLTVLVKGEMKFVGSVEDLRKVFATGFSLFLNLESDKYTDDDDVQRSALKEVKRVVVEKFEEGVVTLVKETEISLYYHIKVNLPWSQAFTLIEDLKKKQKIIADYQLTETSLDEVYLTFYNKVK